MNSMTNRRIGIAFEWTKSAEPLIIVMQTQKQIRNNRLARISFFLFAAVYVNQKESDSSHLDQEFLEGERDADKEPFAKGELFQNQSNLSN